MSDSEVEKYLEMARDDVKVATRITSLTSGLKTLSAEEISALHILVQLLQSRFDAQLYDVILFGSKARGEATSESDIDVLIILEHPSAQDEGDARGFSFDVWLESKVFLSVHFIDRQTWDSLKIEQNFFYCNVKRDGISLLPQTV